MSVATQHSPFTVGSKRGLYESEENEDRLQRLDSTATQPKRYRARGSPGRCADAGFHPVAYSVGHATVAALRGLFPEMTDKVIADVLAEYGDNIDAAIKHLTDLRLSTGGGGAQPQQPQQQQQAAAAAAAQQTQGQQAQEQQRQQQGAAGAHAAAAAANGQPQSADQWVDLVVGEMSAAGDMADARRRASEVLQAFEQAAVTHAKAAQGGEPERLRSQLAEAQRENALLKRAVAIQNSRMQELSGKEAEAAQLRAALEGYQQRVQALEVQNYTPSRSHAWRVISAAGRKQRSYAQPGDAPDAPPSPPPSDVEGPVDGEWVKELAAELTDQLQLGRRGEAWFAAQVAAFLLVVFPPEGLRPLVDLLCWGGALAGLALAIGGQHVLGKRLTPLPAPREQTSLVTTGAYSLCRHPMYGGIALVALGWSLATGDELRLAFALLTVLVLDRKAAYEEGLLEERFGDAYVEYKRATKKLIPFIY
ncbi:S-isoprenylcysteine O-methyltransferase [Micractinium conductrix]|uniref:S-isoprenylcysteine O-methyltransferase n=1 Tax=Micractinium conductrix TaxID=554055 RepID=A0A2P6VMT6_9CHLO|nr:S-isoprenylcysteine O-methyltransferase [Micractinium conductrix]|eukprot:PSC75400.1 S-isoprenylcysteine O-methyltransferase [Micractinium conductrix]